MTHQYTTQDGTSQDRLKTVGYFTPTYLSPIKMATISEHTGVPMFKHLNEFWGYWTTGRELTREEVIKYLGPSYLDNMRKK